MNWSSAAAASGAAADEKSLRKLQQEIDSLQTSLGLSTNLVRDLRQEIEQWKQYVCFLKQKTKDDGDSDSSKVAGDGKKEQEELAKAQQQQQDELQGPLVRYVQDNTPPQPLLESQFVDVEEFDWRDMYGTFFPLSLTRPLMLMFACAYMWAYNVLQRRSRARQ